MNTTEAEAIPPMTSRMLRLAISAGAALWLAVLLMHLLSEWPPFDGHLWATFGRAGVGGVIGFWLSYGSGRWWVRLPLAALMVWALVAGKVGEAQLIVPLCALGTAGASFVAGMALSLGRGTPGRQFSILHGMGITALVAVSMGILQAVSGGTFFTMEMWRLAYALTFLSIISTIMALQCLTLLLPWGTQLAAAMLGLAGFVLGAAMSDYVIRTQVLDFGNSMSETLTFHVVYAAMLWLTLVPLEVALAGIGRSMIAARWKDSAEPPMSQEPSPWDEPVGA